MRFASLLLAAVLGLAPANPSTANSDAQSAAGSPAESSAPVVVELFTSEGCSSCPPADALLANLERAQPIRGAQIIAIEEHVDYWNHQGWVDPFSSADWTARQQDYASAFRQNGGYTPQMVVGGREQFVGSRSDLAAKAIGAGRNVPTVMVTLAKAGADKSNEAQVSISVGKLSLVSPGDSAEIWLAVTESGLSSQVSAGENAGRNLRHAPVLRSLRHIGAADAHAGGPSFQGNVAVRLKSEWKRENLTAVILVQEKRSKHILGAASLKIAG